MILGRSGRPMVCLGGQAAYRQYRKGDLVASLQYLDLGDKDRGPEPVMAIFKADVHSDAGAFVISARRAHEYADSRGNPTPDLMLASIRCCEALGMFPDRFTAARIVDLIVDGLPDLILMPTLPSQDTLDIIAPKAAPQGIELTAKVNGKTFKEALL